MKPVRYYIIFFLLLNAFTARTQSFHSQILDADKIENGEEAINVLQVLAQEAKRVVALDTLALIQLDIASNFFYYSISFDSAVFYCDQALSILQENVETYKAAYLRAWYNKGYYYRKWDKFEKSKEALNIVLDEPENNYTYRATWQLGKLYKDRGEFAMAFNYYLQALELAGDDIKKRIRVYEYMSFAYIIMGTDDGARQAIHWLNKLEQGVKSLPDNSEDDYLPLVAYNKGQCHYQLGDLKKAKALVEEADKLINECCDDPDFEGLIADFQGFMEYENGNFQEAIKYYQKGLALFQYSYDLGRGQGLAGSYYALAEAYRDLGQLDSAMLYVNYTIIDRTYGFDNNLEGKAFPTVDQMILNGEKAYLLEDLMLKADIYEKRYDQGQVEIDSSIRYYELAEQVLDAMTYNHVEEDTKIFWRQIAKNIYYELIRLYLINGRVDRAFSLSEKSKYVILEEHLRKIDLSTQKSTLPLINEYQRVIDSLRNEEIKAKNSQLQLINTDHNLLVNLRNKEDDLLNKIKHEHPTVYQKIFNWEPVDIPRIQQKLKNDGAIFVEFFVHDSMSYVFILNGHQLAARSLPPRHKLASKITEFLSYFDPQKSSEIEAKKYSELSYDIFSTLLDSTEISRSEQLVIVPDDVLSLLPFEVLTYQSDIEPMDYNSLSYLLTWKPIRYLINAKAMYKSSPANGAKVNHDVISFLPDFDNTLAHHSSVTGPIVREDLVPLAGATKEVEKLCDIFKCETFDFQVGERLFCEQVKKRSKIVHIATHARMNDSIPDQSHLIMQDIEDADHDNFVHVFELKNQKIVSDLVVLSACNTGVGKIYRGEGLASLGIAFHYAGSPNLVTSLWSVPDQSSSLIMQKFYEKLKNNVPKHKALRDAKLYYLTEFPTDVKHPFYWGGFLYYGNDLALSNQDSIHIFSSKGYVLITLFLLVFLIILLIRKSKLKSGITHPV